MDNYNRVVHVQKSLQQQWIGLRAFNNRVKALLIQYITSNANCLDLEPLFLDGACGRGGDIQKWESASSIIETRKITVWGIDIAEDAVREANRRVQETRLKWCEFYALHGDLLLYNGEEDPKLAGITLHFCINYIWTKDVDNVLQALRRSIKPAGLVSVIFTNADKLHNAPFDMVKRHTRTIYTFSLGGLVDSVPEYYVSMDTLLKGFTDAGFVVKHRWDDLSVAFSELQSISKFLKPPLPISRVEQCVAACYSACVFSAPE